VRKSLKIIIIPHYWANITLLTIGFILQIAFKMLIIDKMIK